MEHYKIMDVNYLRQAYSLTVKTCQVFQMKFKETVF